MHRVMGCNCACDTHSKLCDIYVFLGIAMTISTLVLLLGLFLPSFPIPTIMMVVLTVLICIMLIIVIAIDKCCCTCVRIHEEHEDDPF